MVLCNIPPQCLLLCVCVQVFWPIAVTMLITEVVPTDWTFADGSGAAPVQAALAAVLSVKVISKVPRYVQP